MPQGHNGHIEDGRFGVTRVSCRCHVCYKGFVRVGAEALIPLNSIANYKINKVLDTVLRGNIDNYYPENYQEWCILKLHVCEECWQKSMSKKIKKQIKQMEKARKEEADPIEEAKEEDIVEEDDVEEIYTKYEEIKKMIRDGSYIKKYT